VGDGENGFIIGQRDVEGMAVRLSELARRPELRERMASAARDRARAFTLDHMVRDTVALYGESGAASARGGAARQ